MSLKCRLTFYLFQIFLTVFYANANLLTDSSLTRNTRNSDVKRLGQTPGETELLSEEWWRNQARLEEDVTTIRTNLTYSNGDSGFEKVGISMIDTGLIPSLSKRTSREQEDCMCVVYYQCDETGTIKTDGADILDIRQRLHTADDYIYNVKVCPNENSDQPMQCCKLPPGVTVPTSNIDISLPQRVILPLPITTTLKPCGTRNGYDLSSINQRLSSPDDTTEGEFPWMLALLGPNEKDEDDSQQGVEEYAEIRNIFKCGASLIHPKVAITSAHCITNRSSVKYIIRAGEYDTSGQVEALPHQDRRVVEILIPNNYNTRSLYHDLALLILDEPITPADNVGTICLPEFGDIFDNQLCVATGWGRSTLKPTTSNSGVLKKVDLSVVPSQQCQQQLRTTRLGTFFILDPSFVCAKGQRQQDTCSGDGGGPLVCHGIHDKDHYALTGTVAWGIGCGDETPGVYASIARDRLWINLQMSARGLAANEPL